MDAPPATPDPPSRNPSSTKVPMPSVTESLRRHLPPTRSSPTGCVASPTGRMPASTGSFPRSSPSPKMRRRVQAIPDRPGLQAPVTFRAAGTSLSGQAITDGVLVLIGEGFASCEIAPTEPRCAWARHHRRQANPAARRLRPQDRSRSRVDQRLQDGGIAANNAPGCAAARPRTATGLWPVCGLLLADGAVLDTEDPLSVDAFNRSHAGLAPANSRRMAAQTRSNPQPSARIRRKFKIKNTTGYSLNAWSITKTP